MRFEASTTVQVHVAKVCSILLHDPSAVFGYADDVEQLRESRVFRTELSLDLGAGASVHQKVTLQQGLPQSGERGLVLPLTWQATGHERLLPTFDGELEIAESTPGRTTLRLIGTYTVPLGLVGSVANSAVGRRLARRSLGALVERFRHRIECEAGRRLDSVETVECRCHSLRRRTSTRRSTSDNATAGIHERVGSGLDRSEGSRGAVRWAARLAVLTAEEVVGPSTCSRTTTRGSSAIRSGSGSLVSSIAAGWSMTTQPSMVCSAPQSASRPPGA